MKAKNQRQSMASQTERKLEVDGMRGTRDEMVGGVDKAHIAGSGKPSGHVKVRRRDDKAGTKQTGDEVTCNRDTSP
jgi:hypothetical protein